MTLLLLVSFCWLSARTLLIISQIDRHTEEAQLGRSFQQELRSRGLMAKPPSDPS